MKLLIYSRSIKYGWKTKVDAGFRNKGLTMERNIQMEDVNNSVMNLGLNTNLQHLTLHNRMMWMKEKTGALWKGLDACYLKKSC